MASEELNFAGNSSRTKRLSSEFCTSIPIVQLHSIFKLLQIDFLVFVGKHTSFCITTKLPLILVLRVGKLVAIYHISL